MSKLLVKVLQNNIREGEQGSESFGPLALAIRRQLRTGDVSVTDQNVTIQGRQYQVTQRLGRFIRQFNKSRKLVKPTNFRLSPLAS